MLLNAEVLEDSKYLFVFIVLCFLRLMSSLTAVGLYIPASRRRRFSLGAICAHDEVCSALVMVMAHAMGSAVKHLPTPTDRGQTPDDARN